MSAVLAAGRVRYCSVRRPSRPSSPLKLGRGRKSTLWASPPPRPTPPKATRWWLTAAAFVALATVAGIETFQPQPKQPDVPIEATFIPAEDGGEVTFDMADLAVLDVVALGADGLTIVHGNVRAARSQWATGGGAYRLYVPIRTWRSLHRQRV